MSTGHQPKSNEPFDPSRAIPPPSGSGIQSSPQQRLDELMEALRLMQRCRLPTEPELDNGNTIVAYSLPRRLFERLALLLPVEESIYAKP